MIKYARGNLLEARVDALVNTVNCVGVMGKGIALQFKQTFPDNFKKYERACKQKLVVPGHMFVVAHNDILGPKFIINFPTKRHWKDRSYIEDIISGLHDLVAIVRKHEIKSIAIPPLGCGNGGLQWAEVQPLIEEMAKQISEVEVVVYPPASSPMTYSNRIGTTKPNWTRARAMLILLMNQYNVSGYTLSMLEIQKLCYFLQESGEPLRLNFLKAQFGPYAENLHHVLQRLDGHFIGGYGDRSTSTKISLLTGAVEEATTFLAQLDDTDDWNSRFNRVQQIISGFETPYGLELLATTDWVMKHMPDAKSNVTSTINHFRQWNERKKQIFDERHIAIAWKHLLKFI